MNKESGKIRFTLILNTMTVLSTKLYTLGYRDDGLYSHGAFIYRRGKPVIENSVLLDGINDREEGPDD